MAEHIIADVMDMHSLLDSHLSIEDRERLRHDVAAAERGETYDGLPDTPQLYRLRVGDHPEHGVMVHFPRHAQAVIVWLTTRRVIAHVPRWHLALADFFGPDAQISAGLGIRN